MLAYHVLDVRNQNVSSRNEVLRDEPLAAVLKDRNGSILVLRVDAMRNA